jgi:hypothetical protein
MTGLKNSIWTGISQIDYHESFANIVVGKDLLPTLYHTNCPSEESLGCLFLGKYLIFRFYRLAL